MSTQLPWCIDLTSPNVQSAHQAYELPSAPSTQIAPYPCMAEPTPSHVDGQKGHPRLSLPKDLISIVANCEGETVKTSLENMLTSLEPDIFLVVESELDNL